MVTLAELEKLQQADAASLRREDLSKVDGISFDAALPLQELLEKYLHDIKNPYHFCSGEILVHIAYEGSENLSKRLAHYLSSL